MEFYGKQIKKDQLVIALIASANRDEAANPDPELFDITREAIVHVSFGHGIHLCLGLALARLEARVAFNAVLDRFPNMRLVEQEITWTANPFVRGVEQLIVECGDSLTHEQAPVL
jgi:cytochrome P450